MTNDFRYAIACVMLLCYNKRHSASFWISILGEDMISKLRHAFAKDPVLFISGLLAAATAFIVPPSIEYLSYIDVRTLALLFALMSVVSALARLGVLDAAAGFFVRRASSMRSLGFMLTLLCYASSMLITDFFSAVLPAGSVSLVLVLLLCLLLPDRPVTIRTGSQKSPLRKSGSLIVLIALFLLCVAAVLRFIPYMLAVAGVVFVLLFMDRHALKKVDYHLLITFCFFFVFVGNLGRMEAVKNLLGGLLNGREVLVSVIVSQFVSNVPAALMLSEFTQNGKALVTGTNIGGLGTLIASMASLISFKLYAKAEGAQPGKYLKLFSFINFGLLAILLVLALTLFVHL